MRITCEMVAACYSAAQSIYPDSSCIAKKAESIFVDTGMNKGSATDYIRNFFYMQQGKKLGRCMAEKDVRYYFEHIHSDYSSVTLKNALQSLQLYLDSDKQNHPGLKSLLDEFNQKV